jgi:predicted methyltransferase
MEDRGARLTTAAQMAWAQVLRPGDAAVDATAGNGHDTLALAELVGPSGRVWAFDVQEAALESTRARLEAARASAAAAGIPSAATAAAALQPPADDVRLVHACHSRMQEFAGSCAAKVVAFNLGYLPAGGDKSVATRANTTTLALEAALEVLVPGGLLTVVAYTGHPGGREEYEAAAALLAELSPAHFVVAETRLLNRLTAPLLLTAYRRAG